MARPRRLGPHRRQRRRRSGDHAAGDEPRVRPPRRAESQEAFDLLEERFPEASADGGSAQIVFESENGEPLTDESNKAVIDDLAAVMQDSPQIASVTSPFAVDEAGNPIGMISADGQNIAVMQVAYAEPAMELDEGTIDYLEDAIADTEDAGLSVEFGGDALAGRCPRPAPAELIGVARRRVVLVITFGSLVAAGLPLLTALARRRHRHRGHHCRDRLHGPPRVHRTLA